MRYLRWALLLCLLVAATSCGAEFANSVRQMFGIDVEDAPSPGGNPAPTVATVSGIVHQKDDVTLECAAALEGVAVYILKPGKEANAEHAVVDPGHAPTEDTIAYAYTDASGNYSLDDVPMGDHELFFAWLIDDGVSRPKTIADSVTITVNSATETIADDMACLLDPHSGGGCGPGGPMPSSVKAWAYYPGGTTPIDGAAIYVTFDLADTGSLATSSPLVFPPGAVLSTTTDGVGCFLIEDMIEPGSPVQLLPPAQFRTVRVVIVKNDTLGHRWSKVANLDVYPGQNYFYPGADARHIIQLTQEGAGI